MREKILSDIIVAMKEKDKETLSVLRMVKGAMQLAELDKKSELDDIEMTTLLSKQIKTRKDSIEEFKKGSREDLISKTEAEINILNKYMPVLLTEEEISIKVNEVFEIVKPQSQRDIGRVMGQLSSLKGKADMGLVSKIVKEKMGNL